MLTYPWKCTVLHCNHLGNTWKPLVLMTRHFDYCPSASDGDNQSVRSSAPVVSRCFPGGYNVKLYISRGRLAWWLLVFLHSTSLLIESPLLQLTPSASLSVVWEGIKQISSDLTYIAQHTRPTWPESFSKESYSHLRYQSIFFFFLYWAIISFSFYVLEVIVIIWKTSSLMKLYMQGLDMCTDFCDSRLHMMT